MKLEVGTRYGRIRGSETAGIRVFKGVPFASPPRGRRRFLPPVPPEPWKGVRDATHAGPAAPQYGLRWFGWLNAAALPQGEDCLSLSIWTPGLDGRRRPVLVWLHGGGFLVGSGSTVIYDGASLARRGDVVVVTVNYRLGALGFSHLKLLFGEGFEESSNLGLRDQIAALEWVRDNIDRFGGDPGNVTLFGQSAGAMSIGTLLGVPRARPLFHRAICQSGAADNVLDPEEARLVARNFVELLGGPPPSHDALGEIPIEVVLGAQHETMTRMIDRNLMMVFLPAVDGDVIPEQPLDAIARGATAGMPLLIGTTLDEWRLFRLIDEGPFPMREHELEHRFEQALRGDFPGGPDAETAVRDFRAALEARGARTRPGDVWIEFQSARIMHWPAARLAEMQHAGGGTAHTYLFTWRPPGIRRALGACHALDVPFVFGSVQHPLARPLTGFTASAPRLSRKMQHAWLRFAREGRPEHDQLPGWQPYDVDRRATMVLGRRCALAEAPLEAERALLERWRGDPRRRKRITGGRSIPRASA